MRYSRVFALSHHYCTKNSLDRKKCGSNTENFIRWRSVKSTYYYLSTPQIKFTFFFFFISYVINISQCVSVRYFQNPNLTESWCCTRWTEFGVVMTISLPAYIYMSWLYLCQHIYVFPEEEHKMLILKWSKTHHKWMILTVARFQNPNPRIFIWYWR